MLGKNLPVSFCSSFLPRSFQCALCVLRISKKRKHPDITLAAVCNNVRFFFFSHLSIKLESDIFDLRFPFISLPFAAVCSILTARSSDKSHSSEKGKKPNATHTSAQLWGQGRQELCHLLSVRVLVLGLGEEDIFHYNLRNPLHHVAVVVFLCMHGRGHVKSQQETKECCRRMQRTASRCKAYLDVNIELLPNEPVVRVLIQDPGLRVKKRECQVGMGNLPEN